MPQQNQTQRQTQARPHARRVAALRGRFSGLGLDGFLVPHADEYQGETLPPHAERLGWISGFYGSAGEALILAEQAALRVDGRYSLQAAAQADPALFTLLNMPADSMMGWAAQYLPKGAKIGYDPALHSQAQARQMQEDCARHGIEIKPVHPNPIDAIWPDRPVPPQGQVMLHPLRYAGQSSAEKRQQLAADLAQAGEDAVFLARPDSIAWLLNIRGQDVPYTPLALSYAVAYATGAVDWIIDPQKIPPAIQAELGAEISLIAPCDWPERITRLRGQRIRLEAASCPMLIWQQFEAAGVKISAGKDPCQWPKACKNPVEISGMRAAHLRDGLAMIRFLRWLDHHAPQGGVDEISAAQQLQAFRAEDPLWRGASFETISGAGPHGAIVHYRVDAASNRPLQRGELYLVDSGGQYPDGTTDITRTVFIGTAQDQPTAAMRAHFTRVLKGHIALDRAIFPEGTRGLDLDVLARDALWQVGLDYAHGTGHGVGCYLSVHEGPQGISSRNDVPLTPGMILSNEPGYYAEDDYGIRTENLLLVVEKEAQSTPARGFYGFESLTLCPYDQRLIDPALLHQDEIDWLNAYHTRIRNQLPPLLANLPETERAPLHHWLTTATRPLAG